MNKIEEKLAKLHNRKFCILVGNGTTAIYLSLLSQNFKNKKIAIPNNVCMNVVLPIYFSNNVPIFVDIEKESLCMDISLLKREKVDATIGVYSYGNIFDINELESYCQKNSIFLIEDLAVSQGLSYKNRPLGCFGDVSILSFGSGKVIDIGHGGALLTDDSTIYETILDNIIKLKEFELEDENIIDFISKRHTFLYNKDYAKSINKYHREFKELALNNRNYFLYKFDTKYLDLLDSRLSKINYLVKIRKANADYLYSKFKDLPLAYLEVIKAPHSSAFWRFNIFVHRYRDELFSYLLKKKYKVSSWYHSVDLLFEERDLLETPISDWVTKTIINIWVNEDIDKNYLDCISKDIIDFLKEKECQKSIN